MDSIEIASQIKPSERQLAWQRMEFYGFIHYSLNTYTGKEWGAGSESPELFNPASLHTDQWVKSLKAGGMTGVIFTAKHHDGFCLWPSAHTDHSVKNSPWKNGGGDVLGDLAESCRKEDFKLGIYLSPWDRHDHRYGTDEYNDYFKAQLRELLTQYGPIFSVWFDGACGEGKNGIRQKYDWPGYYGLIRELQPHAVISVVGPDVRWCGNEAGHCRKSEWSVVPASLSEAEYIAGKSQQEDDGEFLTRFDATDDDLGSREKIRKAGNLIWYPAETNTSIRPNWFFRESDNRKVKSLNELFNLYCSSVGGNSTLLLNVPPDKRGLINEVDVRRLHELGDCIRELNGGDLIQKGSIFSEEGAQIKSLNDNDFNTYWTAPERPPSHFVIRFHQEVVFNTVFLQEFIEQGQRVESFEIDVKTGKSWKQVYRGTVIGYKKICRFNKARARELRVTISGSRGTPVLRSVRVTRFERVKGLSFITAIKMKLYIAGDKLFTFYMAKIKK